MKKIILYCFIALICACGEDHKNPTTPESSAPPAVTFEIKYEVTGTVSKVNVEYYNETGGLSKQEGVSIPWSYSFTANEKSSVLVTAKSIEGDNENKTKSLTATVYKDKKSIDTKSSDGGGMIFCIAGIFPYS